MSRRARGERPAKDQLDPIRVVDNGPGVPVEHQSGLFEKFFRVPAVRRAVPGLGCSSPAASCRPTTDASESRAKPAGAPPSGSPSPPRRTTVRRAGVNQCQVPPTQIPVRLSCLALPGSVVFHHAQAATVCCIPRGVLGSRGSGLAGRGFTIGMPAGRTVGRRLAGPRFDAEDIVHDVFLVVLRRQHEFGARPGSRPGFSASQPRWCAAGAATTLSAGGCGACMGRP